MVSDRYKPQQLILRASPEEKRSISLRGPRQGHQVGSKRSWRGLGEDLERTWRGFGGGMAEIVWRGDCNAHTAPPGPHMQATHSRLSRTLPRVHGGGPGGERRVTGLKSRNQTESTVIVSVIRPKELFLRSISRSKLFTRSLNLCSNFIHA